MLLFPCHYTETQRSSGWLPCSSLETLKASFNVPSDNHASHRRPFRFCVTLLTAIHYIPRNKLMVHAFLWFVVVRYRSIIPISSKVVSLAPGQTYGYPSANETTLDAMGKYITRFHLQLMITTIKQSITKLVHRSCDYTGLILVLRPANERRRYFVTVSPIGWAKT